MWHDIWSKTLQSEIVIVGGGAGGLELACKLGRKLGPSASVSRE